MHVKHTMYKPIYLRRRASTLLVDFQSSSPCSPLGPWAAPRCWFLRASSALSLIRTPMHAHVASVVECLYKEHQYQSKEAFWDTNGCILTRVTHSPSPAVPLPPSSQAHLAGQPMLRQCLMMVTNGVFCAGVSLERYVLLVLS